MAFLCLARHKLLRVQRGGPVSECDVEHEDGRRGQFPDLRLLSTARKALSFDRCLIAVSFRDISRNELIKTWWPETVLFDPSEPSTDSPRFSRKL